MTDHSTLERRLRDASDPSVWDDVSPDAWQQNERRVAADLSRRGGPRLRIVAAAAAAVVVVGGGVLVSTEFNGSPLAPSAGGSHGTDDPFGPKGRVGQTVVLERFRAQSMNIAHSAFLTRAGGKGLSLCDSFTSPSTGASYWGGCTAGSPSSAASGVDAFAFASGSTSSGIKGVYGAVGPRVASLKAWVGDSEAPRALPLHALGFDGLQAFGLTTLGKHAPVARIAAYDAGGALLQVVDVPSIFGAQWLPDDDTCANTKVVPLDSSTSRIAGPSETVAAAASSLRLSGTDGPSDLCVAAPKGAAASKPVRQGDWVVEVTGPEVASVRVTIGLTWQDMTPLRFRGTPWGVVIVHANPQHQVTFFNWRKDGQVFGPQQYYQLPTN